MKRMMAIAGLAVVLTCGLDVAAAPSQQLRDQIEVLLRAPEYVPSQKEWTDLGADAAVVLRQIALNDKELVLKRGRAATALGFFKSAESQQVLTQLVADDKAYWLLRGKAAHSLAFAYGADSLGVIKPLLDSKHKRTREVAIKAVGIVPTQASRDLLAQRLKKEPNQHLRKTISQAVARIDKQLSKKGAK